MTKAKADRLGKILRSLLLDGFAGTIVGDAVEVYLCTSCATGAWHLRTLADRDAFLRACDAHTCPPTPAPCAPVALDSKVLKCGRLAISAELVGSEHEALQAARTCGTLAAKAGHTLEDLWQGLVGYGLPQASATWYTLVDAHADAQ